MIPADPQPPSDGAYGRTRLILVLSLAWAAVLLFLLFVWPTPWRHPGDREDIRVSRLTGKAEVRDSRSGEWRPAKRGKGNSKGTSGGSPVGGGGGRSGGEGPGETWWYGEDGEARKGSEGDRWWYRGDGGGEAESGDRGGLRRRGAGGSPIGGGRSGEKRSGGGGGGGSPIGGD